MNHGDEVDTRAMLPGQDAAKEGKHKSLDREVEIARASAGAWIEAVQHYKKVLTGQGGNNQGEHKPVNPEVEMAKGDALANAGACIEAVGQYQKVLDLANAKSLVSYRIGEVFFRLHNYNAAAEAMLRALQGDLEPKWIEAWAHLTLGKIFDTCGLRLFAVAEYRLALATTDNTGGALDEARRYIENPWRDSGTNGARPQDEPLRRSAKSP